MSVRIVKPSLERSHLYAAGPKIEGGGFCPVQTFPTLETLESGYRRMYKGAVARGLTRPLAVEKENPNEEWSNARCHTLPELMQKIINEEEPKRDDLEGEEWKSR